MKICLLGSGDVNMLYELVQPTIERAKDPWETITMSVSSSTSSVPKNIILNYYNLDINECMICGESKDVVNAHIWPRHTKGEHLLSMFGLTTECINDPRKFLRLTRSLERAFDNKAVTIIQKHTKFVLFVLDPNLRKQPVAGTDFNFHDCHQWPITFKNANRQFLRILAAHCKNSFAHAYRLQMIHYDTYQLGNRSSKIMVNMSLDGNNKAKIIQWFSRNEKLKEEEKQW